MNLFFLVEQVHTEQDPIFEPFVQLFVLNIQHPEKCIMIGQMDVPFEEVEYNGHLLPCYYRYNAQLN